MSPIHWRSKAVACLAAGTSTLAPAVEEYRPPEPRHDVRAILSGSMRAGAPTGVEATLRLNLGRYLANVHEYDISGGPPLFEGLRLEAGGGPRASKLGIGYAELGSGEWGGGFHLEAVRYAPWSDEAASWSVPGVCTGVELATGFVMVEVAFGLLKCKELDAPRPVLLIGFGI